MPKAKVYHSSKRVVSKVIDDYLVNKDLLGDSINPFKARAKSIRIHYGAKNKPKQIDFYDVDYPIGAEPFASWTPKR
jgi:hypothetical protein